MTRRLKFAAKLLLVTLIIIILVLLIHKVQRIRYLDNFPYTGEIPIEGSTAFKNRVNGCLKILAAYSPNDYDFVKRYVKVIELHKSSGMRVWDSPPTFQLSQKVAFNNIYWCASSIAHDAYHSYQYQSFLPKNGARTPKRYWNSFEAERQANEYQKKVLERINAPSYLLSYMNSLDGTHADLDGDGKYTKNDYLNRRW